MDPDLKNCFIKYVQEELKNLEATLAEVETHVRVETVENSKSQNGGAEDGEWLSDFENSDIETEESSDEAEWENDELLKLLDRVENENINADSVVPKH